MAWLIGELVHHADNGKLLELQEVWQRYCTLIQDAGLKIPKSYLSRLTTFKEKLEQNVETLYECIVLYNQTRTEARTVFVPLKFKHIPISLLKENESYNDSIDLLKIPTFKGTRN